MCYGGYYFRPLLAAPWAFWACVGSRPGDGSWNLSSLEFLWMNIGILSNDSDFFLPYLHSQNLSIVCKLSGWKFMRFFELSSQSSRKWRQSNYILWRTSANDGMQTGWAIRLSRSGSLQGEEILWSSCRWAKQEGMLGGIVLQVLDEWTMGPFIAEFVQRTYNFCSMNPYLEWQSPSRWMRAPLVGLFVLVLSTRNFWHLEAISEWLYWRSMCSGEVVQRLQQVWNLFEISWKVGRFASCKIVVHWAWRFEPTVRTWIDRGNLEWQCVCSADNRCIYSKRPEIPWNVKYVLRKYKKKTWNTSKSPTFFKFK